MKISEMIFNKLHERSLEDNSIGFYHPMGSFIDENKNEFVLILNGTTKIKDDYIDYDIEGYYIVEFNQYLFMRTTGGFLVKFTPDLDQKTDKLLDLVINVGLDKI